MEFPHIGANCSESSCKQLDFLPMKCDACSLIFCKDHIMYSQHSCKESYKKENQVPVCPLCNRPIPVKKGEVPDIAVGQHIDNDCQSDPAKEQRKKVYSNKCSFKGCKAKELVPFNCDRCHLNYCIRHRHETDHSCQGFQGSGQRMSRTGAAALARLDNQPKKAQTAVHQNQPKKPQTTMMSSIGSQLNQERQERNRMAGAGGSIGGRSTAQQIQGSLSETEALSRAMALSLAQDMNPSQRSQNTSNPDKEAQEAEDLALAQALAASERQARQSQTTARQNSKEKSCRLS